MVESIVWAAQLGPLPAQRSLAMLISNYVTSSSNQATIDLLWCKISVVEQRIAAVLDRCGRTAIAEFLRALRYIVFAVSTLYPNRYTSVILGYTKRVDPEVLYAKRSRNDNGVSKSFR